MTIPCSDSQGSCIEVAFFIDALHARAARPQLCGWIFTVALQGSGCQCHSRWLMLHVAAVASQLPVLMPLLLPTFVVFFTIAAMLPSSPC